MSANKVQPAKLSKGQRKRARAAALKAAQATGQPAPSSSKRQQLAQKSQSKSHQVVRPQQPYPNAFLGAPVEVLARIIRLLLPVDVMALARTNTTLRKFLMNRSAGHIWRASIQNVEGLPACPTEICEPLYVSLIYTPACSVCGKGENRSMDTYLYIRACLRCRNLLVIDWEKIKPPEVQSLVFASSGLFHTRNTITIDFD
ncbi:hypothetical protein BDV93DRAFT_490972 [Ceratobasidium sp. AG-I]|nr:hypothetical protein BDV93DRAFT_490972 [Ceratobasidium sp. AG-I]